MSNEALQMARFLLVATIILASAEYLTRRSLGEGTRARWSVMACMWLAVVGMLMWTIDP